MGLKFEKESAQPRATVWPERAKRRVPGAEVRGPRRWPPLGGSGGRPPGGCARWARGFCEKVGFRFCPPFYVLGTMRFLATLCDLVSDAPDLPQRRGPSGSVRSFLALRVGAPALPPPIHGRSRLYLRFAPGAAPARL